jgi:glycosyltransferase involved in cell wall biosynthesis
MKSKVRFSIITPTLNSQKYISKNIKSVLCQSYKNYEQIIVDGKSSDKTINKINKLKNGKIKIIEKKDKNLWHAINRGIKISKGEIICILNSDDFFYKDALKTINKYFRKHKKLDYIFGAVEKKNRILYRLEKNKIFYKFNVYPSHSVSFFVKKKIHKKIGLYNLDYAFCSDYDFFFKLFSSKSFYGMNTKKNEVIGYFRSGGISESVSFVKKLFYEFKIRYENKQNILFLIILFFLLILNKYRNLLIKNLFIKKKFNIF